MSESTPEQRLLALGITLPNPTPPGGIYKKVTISNNQLFVSGNVPVDAEGNFITGRAGDDLTVAEAKTIARRVGLIMLANIKGEIGSLNRIKKLVKTLGMVNSTPDFAQQPEVINGYSELMRDIFGPDNGLGARSAVGMMLPRNVAVEIEAIFELND